MLYKPIDHCLSGLLGIFGGKAVTCVFEFDKSTGRADFFPRLRAYFGCEKQAPDRLLHPLTTAWEHRL
jgi:hypothetical protein